MTKMSRHLVQGYGKNLKEDNLLKSVIMMVNYHISLNFWYFPTLDLQK